MQETQTKAVCGASQIRVILRMKLQIANTTKSSADDFHHSPFSSLATFVFQGLTRYEKS